MQRVLGIDLGTTNSVVAHVRRGEPEILPNGRNEDSTSSVVARGRRGELLIGTAARGRAGVDDANVIRSIKRFMGRVYSAPDVQAVLERMTYEVAAGDDGDVTVRFGGRAYTPTEISSMILGKLKADAESRVGIEFPRAVITVPAYFGERQVAATREAGRMAGFHVLKVLDEPTAAALAYGYTRESPDDDQTMLVFDMGGGTFDISVLLLVGGIFTVLCVEGDNLLGGDDFDRLIVDRVLAATRTEQNVDLSADRAALHKLTDAAESAKIALSDEQDTEIILPGVGTPPITVEHELSRTELTELIRGRIDRAMELVITAVAGAHLDPAEIDQVLLVGGSAAIPYVTERLAAVFGREKIRMDVHPMKSVALGAAIQGSLVSEAECLNCSTASPIAADDCVGCGRSLLPPPKVACSACHLYSDVGTGTCPKCGNGLTGAAPIARAHAPHRPADPTEGGLRCLACRTINVAGAITCSACGEPFESPVEVTAQDLGIEVQDGSMAVVVPKGTVFPTPADAPLSEDFATAVTDQRRLEIAVYQGGEPTARLNELCGYLTLSLPPGLPRNSPIKVSFGLDGSRMLTLWVRVRALGEVPRKVTFQHGSQMDPQDLQRLETHRRTITNFVDRWATELTPAESAVFYQMIAELDELIGSGAAGRERVDEVAARSDRLVELVAEIRGQDAYLSAVRFSIGRYLADSELVKLEDYSAAISEARERADWGAARILAGQAHATVENYGRTWQNFVYFRTFAVQGKLSPALSQRVLELVRAFDTAHTQGDENAKAAAMEGLGGLASEVAEEITGLPQHVDAITRPKRASG